MRSKDAHKQLARTSLNGTRERRVELDAIGESYLVRGLIMNSFSVLVNVRLCFQLCG